MLNPPNYVIPPSLGLDAATLDELLEPVAALISDPRKSNREVRPILERLAYLKTRGPARDGRKEFLQILAFNAISLYTEELRYIGHTDPLMKILERALTLYITGESQGERRSKLMQEISYAAVNLYAAELRRFTPDDVPDLVMVAQGLGIPEPTARLMYALGDD